MKEIKQLINITKKLANKYKKYDKRFTLAGNLVGDIGEVLAVEKYKLKLLNRGSKKHDAEEEGSNKKVQIKSSLKGKCYISYNYVPDYFLAIHITLDGEVEEMYNGPGKYLVKNYVKSLQSKQKRHYILYRNKLEKLNKEINPKDKIKER